MKTKKKDPELRRCDASGMGRANSSSLGMEEKRRGERVIRGEEAVKIHASPLCSPFDSNSDSPTGFSIYRFGPTPNLAPTSIGH
ncbi:hypothetical protein ACFX13_001140 [Malus domestica]